MQIKRGSIVNIKPNGHNYMVLGFLRTDPSVSVIVRNSLVNVKDNSLHGAIRNRTRFNRAIKLARTDNVVRVLGVRPIENSEVREFPFLADTSLATELNTNRAASVAHATTGF